jgi:hypothetical protein
MMMAAARTSETLFENYFTRQYIPENSELHTRRRENLKSHKQFCCWRHSSVSISFRAAKAISSGLEPKTDFPRLWSLLL